MEFGHCFSNKLREQNHDADSQRRGEEIVQQDPVGILRQQKTEQLVESFQNQDVQGVDLKAALEFFGQLPMGNKIGKAPEGDYQQRNMQQCKHRIYIRQS